MPLKISALVPVLNEEGTAAQALWDLRLAGLDEVIVVDGGSSDRTLERAQPLADRLLRSDGGLFQQLNRAAEVATGDVLLFHYADVRFPRSGRAAIERQLVDPSVLGGAFRLGFDSPRLTYHVIAAGANVRNRLGIGPFGDQTIFVRTEVFRLLGGFEPEAFLADLHLVQRIKRLGGFQILSGVVRASVRRWEKRGILRTMLAHWRLTLLFMLARGRRLDSEAKRARDLTRVR